MREAVIHLLDGELLAARTATIASKTARIKISEEASHLLAGRGLLRQQLHAQKLLVKVCFEVVDEDGKNRRERGQTE
eukprot:scaffold931_cov200-Ochromonas_danica.AAC.13